MMAVHAMLKLDNIPKIIEDCLLNSGDVVAITYGKGLAWATVVSP